MRGVAPPRRASVRLVRAGRARRLRGAGGHRAHRRAGAFDDDIKRVGESRGRRGESHDVFVDSLWILAVDRAGARASARPRSCRLLVARRIVRPVGEVRDATRRLADGHYDERVAEPAELELAELAADVNRLGGRARDDRAAPGAADLGGRARDAHAADDDRGLRRRDARRGVRAERRGLDGGRRGDVPVAAARLRPGRAVTRGRGRDRAHRGSTWASSHVRKRRAAAPAVRGEGRDARGRRGPPLPVDVDPTGCCRCSPTCSATRSPTRRPGAGSRCGRNADRHGRGRDRSERHGHRTLSRGPRARVRPLLPCPGLPRPTGRQRHRPHDRPGDRPAHHGDIARRRPAGPGVDLHARAPDRPGRQPPTTWRMRNRSGVPDRGFGSSGSRALLVPTTRRQVAATTFAPLAPNAHFRRSTSRCRHSRSSRCNLRAANC